MSRSDRANRRVGACGWKQIGPEKSPSSKLAARGAEVLTDGSAEDLNGHSGTSDSLHATQTNSVLTRYKRNKRGTPFALVTLIGRVSDIYPRRTCVV